MITIYTKDWCGSCTRAKNYFIENDIEYEEIFGSFLELTNPNATSTCGCGESFGT